MTITEEHERTMRCLPFDGRWRMETQLVGMTKLAGRTRTTLLELEAGGFCEHGDVEIAIGMTNATIMKMYHCPVVMRMRYEQELKNQRQ